MEIVTHESDADYYGFTIRKIRKPAAKKVKVHPLTAESLKQLGVGLKMFGEYTFGDKGPHEVMDVDALADKYHVLPATEAAALLLELYKSKEHKGYGSDLACSIICRLQDWPELFECPEVANEIDW